MKLTKNAMMRLAKLTLAQASVGDLRVRIEASAQGNTRFALGGPTTGGDVERLTVAVTANQGSKSATAKGSATDEAGLLALVQRAEAMAAVAPDDPEHMPPLGATTYAKSKRRDAATAAMGAPQRDALVAAAVGAAAKQGVQASGFVSHRSDVVVVADRAGLLAADESTSVSMTTTCRTAAGGSARRAFVSHAVKGLDGAALSTDAAQWAKRSNAPTAMDPGTYTVVLAPAAVAELLDFLVDALGSRAATEGRSVFSAPGGGTMLGERLFAPTVQLFSDPTHPRYPAAPMADSGVPQTRTEWIVDGRLHALRAGRYWADRAGVPLRPRPSSIHLAAGEAAGDLMALVGQVDRGVLVSRFWYSRMLQRRSLTVTGMTRDGTFAIEKGKIARPIKNFRYNDSPLTMLSRLAVAGAASRTLGERVTVVPPLVVDGFHFESLSDAT